MQPFDPLDRHLDDLVAALDDLRRSGDEIEAWGIELARVLGDGGRLLAAGNGGSAAEAQHLTAELSGRFERTRRPLSAIPLHGDTSALTAILNDFDPDEVFARQAEAHGRPGDVLVLMSTSGRSSNLVAAARRGRSVGMQVWAMTGPVPNPLAAESDRVLSISVPSTTAVQEAQLVAVHAVCAAVERHLVAADPATVIDLRAPSRMPLHARAVNE
ncbi:MAG: SIS domain-containing protein [Kineosporiaceae bacterium]